MPRPRRGVSVAAMHAEVTARLERFYAALADDRGEALAALRPDVEWVIGGGSGFAGAYQGRAEVAALWSRMRHLGCLPEPRRVFVGDAQAAVIGRLGASEIAEVFDFDDDGLVRRYRAIGYAGEP